jgi:phosphoglucosamine mutase
MTHQRTIEFGTDGIRGVAGEYPLDPETVLHIGRAIGRWLRGRTPSPHVIIGRDTRASGPMIAHTLTGGLLAEGVNVHDQGVISTPGIAYLTHAQGYDLGIVISASHNPAAQNGIKVFGADGFKLHDDDERAVAVLAGSALPEARAVFAAGVPARPPRDSGYVDHLVAPFGFREFQNLTLVLDCANGAASAIAPDVFQRRPRANVIALNAAPDGLNINVDAGSEHVRRDRSALLEAVRLHNADLGIAFDGDADRVVFVTPEGMLIDGDHVLGILALEMREMGRLPGATVVATDMSNSGLEHFLAGHDIGLARTRVGDKYVMARMRSGGFALGGEQAGHVIVLDDARTAGDGIYIGLLVASLAARYKRQGGPTLHELAARIPRYPQVIASAHLARQADLKGVPGLADLTRAALESFAGKGRVNVRFSGTEPNLLRAMVEGGPDTTLGEVIAQARSLCGLVAAATETPHPAIDIVDCVTGAPVTG